MTFKKHQIKHTSKDLFSFDCSTNSPSIPGTSLTTTQGAIFHHRYPSYSCRCTRGYSLSSDPENIWKRQEDIEIYSRRDVARVYRLERWF